MVRKIGLIVLRIIIIIVLIALVIQFLMLRGTHEQRISYSNSRVHYSNVPTMVIPGWGGSSWAFQKLILKMQRQNIAQKTMTIWVSPSGHVRFKGNLHHKNAIIQLLFDWNYTSSYHAQIKQLTRVLTLLSKNYHVKTMNVIAHSYGGTEWLHAYIGSKYIQRHIAFPKVVFLGVPVDETFGSGTKFTKLLFKKSTDRNFKKMQHQVRNSSLVHIGTIYNWMGSTKGRTDGEVPHVQSQMLRSLLHNKRVKYSEKIYPHTSHIQLHQKDQILSDIARVLWYKE